MRVNDPQGRKFKVKRRWLPWRRRTKGATDWMDFGVDLGDDPISTVIGAILLVPLVLVLVLWLGELLLLLLLLPVVMLARSVFGTPWTVEITSDGDLRYSEAVKGWSASGQRIQQLAAMIRDGAARDGRPPWLRLPPQPQPDPQRWPGPQPGPGGPPGP